MQPPTLTPKRIPFMEHDAQILKRATIPNVSDTISNASNYSNTSIDISNYEPLKLLVHNVSHADLCVTIQPDSVIGISRKRELMARPRSSRYKVCVDYMLISNI